MSADLPVKPGKLIKFTLRAARRDGMVRGATITLPAGSDRARVLLKDAGWDHVFVTGSVPPRPPPVGEVPAGGISPKAAAAYRGLVQALKQQGAAACGLSRADLLEYAQLCRDNRDALVELLAEAAPVHLVEEPALDPDDSPAPAEAPSEPEEEAGPAAAPEGAPPAEEEPVAPAPAPAPAPVAPAQPAPVLTAAEAGAQLKAALAAPKGSDKADLIALAKTAGLPVPGTLAKLNKADVVTALSELVAGAGI